MCVCVCLCVCLCVSVVTISIKPEIHNRGHLILVSFLKIGGIEDLRKICRSSLDLSETIDCVLQFSLLSGQVVSHQAETELSGYRFNRHLSSIT